MTVNYYDGEWHEYAADFTDDWETEFHPLQYFDFIEVKYTDGTWSEGFAGRYCWAAEVNPIAKFRVLSRDTEV